MSDREPSSYTVEDLANPQIDPATLGKIASVRPDLWSAILTHPNCYPELAEFIRQHQPAQEAAPVAETTAPAIDFGQPAAEETAPAEASAPAESAAPAIEFGQPAAADPAPAQPDYSQPAQPNYGQPAQPQYPGQPDYGQAQQPNYGQPGQQNVGQPQAQPGQQPQGNNAGEQIADGAKQLADGVKDYFSNTVAPGFQAALNDANTQTGKNAWLNWLTFAIPGAALLSIIFLFLPAVSASVFGGSYSVNYFGLGAIGVVLLLSFLIVIAISAYQLFNRTSAGNETLTGVAVGVTTLAGITGLIFGFAPAAGGAPGVGAILLIITSLVLIAGGVLTLLKKKLQA